MSLQITADLEAQLAAQAAVEHRTSDELAQEAISGLLASRAEHHRAIERARESLAAGRTIPHEEVFARLKARMGW